MFSFFFFNDPATTEISTLSLHDALPISPLMEFTLRRELYTDASTGGRLSFEDGAEMYSLEPAREHPTHPCIPAGRSEEHTSELQSQSNLVCRLLLEKKKTPKHVELEREP